MSEFVPKVIDRNIDFLLVLERKPYLVYVGKRKLGFCEIYKLKSREFFKNGPMIGYLGSDSPWFLPDSSKVWGLVEDENENLFRVFGEEVKQFGNVILIT